MHGIHKHTKPESLKLFLAKPNKKILFPLKYASNERLALHEASPHELSFSLPYDVIDNHNVTSYEPVEHLREKFLIKVIFKGEEMWFVIRSYGKSSDTTNTMDVTCYSLEHTLAQKKLIDFHRESVNLLTVAEEVAERYGWKIGYINPNLNLKWREFDISSTPVLSFFYDDLTETYDTLVVFDTVNEEINFYEKGELSHYKGFTLNERRYLQSIEEEIDSNEVVTRLHLTGSDGLGIQRINPTGQRYIDDLSYFLYPFEMDEDENVIKSSTWMEDDLAKALVKYNQYVSSRNDEFYGYTLEKTSKQEELTEESNVLFELNTELKIIKDSIAWRKEQGINTSDLIKERNAKNAEIKRQQAKINSINNNITAIDNNIAKLRDDLKMENHFSPTQFKELQKYIHEYEWNDSNKIDDNDLYETGLKRLTEINSPPVNISTSIVNFFEDVNAQDDWDRLNLGDVIRIQHEGIRVNAKARLSSIIIDFEAPSIDVEISNMKELNDISNKLKSMFYTVDKVKTDFNKVKIDYSRVANNFNLRNDRISEIPATPQVGQDAIQHKENDNASVDITVRWNFPEYSDTKKNEHNIDGFMLYFYSDDTDESYEFTSQMAHEQIRYVPYSTRTFTYPALPPNKFYTIGVRAYRRVDPDISSDVILMSPIIRFNDGLVQSDTVQTFSLMNISTQNNSEDEEEYVDNSKPYQPSKEVNYKGKIFGKRVYLDEKDLPDTPEVDDLRFNSETNQWERWDGENWIGDIELRDFKEQVGQFEKEVKDFEEKFQKDFEENDGIIKDTLQDIANEMDRINNDLIPEVEQVVSERLIPRYDTEPDVPPPSGLYWDTSQNPPKMMRWDEEKGQFVPLAPTEAEIAEMMQKMRKDAISESVNYSKETVVRVRKDLQEKIADEITTVTENIQELLDIKDELIDLADGLDAKLEEYDGKFASFEHTVDEVNRQINTTIEEVERVDGVVQGHSNQISINAEAIEAKLDSVTYERDMDGVLESIEQHSLDIQANAEGLEARLTRDEYRTDKEGIDEFISSTETTLGAHAGLIEAKAEKTELENYIDLQTYRNEIGEFTVGTGTIIGRVEATEADIDTISNNYDTFYQDYSEFKLESDSFQARVGTLSDDGVTLVEQIGSIELTANSLRNTIEAIEVGVGEDFEEYLISTKTVIEQLPNQIELAVSEGVNGLGVGGTNLALGTKDDDWAVYGSVSNTNLSSRQGDRTKIIRVESIGLQNKGIQQSVSNRKMKLKSGEKYTLSFLVRGTVSSLDYTFIMNNGSSNQSIYGGNDVVIKSSTEFHKMIINFTANSYADESTGSYIMISGRDIPEGQWFEVQEVKLEKGSIATDWSSAEEDGVNKTNVLSSINLSPEGVKIEGDKIDIIGLVSVLNADGTPGTMIDGGKIVANSINANRLAAGTVIAGDVIFSGHLEGATGSFAGKLESITTTGTDTREIVDINYGGIITLSVDQFSSPSPSSATRTRLSGGVFTSARYQRGFTFDYDNLHLAHPNDGHTLETLHLSSQQLLSTVYSSVAGNNDIENQTRMDFRRDSFIIDTQQRLDLHSRYGDVLIQSLNYGSTAGEIYIGRGKVYSESARNKVYISGSVQIDDTGFLGRTSFESLETELGAHVGFVNSPGSGTFGETVSALGYKAESGGYNNGYTFGHTTVGFNGSTHHSLSSNATTGEAILYAHRFTDQNWFTLRTHDQFADFNNAFYISRRGTMYVPATYDNTTTNSANIRVGTAAGHFTRNTSLREYKLNIEDAKDPYKLLNLSARTWYDRGDSERYAAEMHKKEKGEDYSLDNVEYIKRIGGLVAEEVVEAGLEIYAEYDENGNLNGVAYDRIWTLLIPIVKDHDNKISQLELEVTQLVPHIDNEMQKLEIKVTNEVDSLRAEVVQLKTRIEELERDSA